MSTWGVIFSLKLPFPIKLNHTWLDLEAVETLCYRLTRELFGRGCKTNILNKNHCFFLAVPTSFLLVTLKVAFLLDQASI